MYGQGNTDSAIKQTDAPSKFGTHYIDNEPYRLYHSSLKYFFESLPKNVSPISILDVACGNEKRVLEGMKHFGRPIKLTAVDIIAPSDLGETSPNVSRDFSSFDLRKTWPFPDNSFDGVLFMWAIHWFGLEGSQNALDNLARVLKPGASAIISTLTPFDVVLKNHVFLRNKISKNALKKIYPQAQIIGNHKDNEPTWVVRNDREVIEQLKLNKNKYFLKNGHPLSNIGEKTMIGFMPDYLKAELTRRGLDVIMEVIKPNKDYPNKYHATLPEGKSQLIYVIRKKLLN